MMKDAAYYDAIYSGHYNVDLGRVELMASLCQGRVLDLGCGDGVLANYYDGPYFGVDFSQKAIELAMSKTVERWFLCWDFLGTDSLPGGPWGTVVLGEVLEHIADEAQATLFGKIAEVLAPWSKLVVSVPHGDAIPDEAHVRTFDEASLRATLERFGTVQFHDYKGGERFLVASTEPKEGQ